MEYKAMAELKIDYLENAARAFAWHKANKVSPLIVDNMRNYLNLPPLNPQLKESAENDMTQYMAAFMKRELIEFTLAWTAELERQVEVYRRLNLDMLALQTYAPIE